MASSQFVSPSDSKSCKDLSTNAIRLTKALSDRDTLEVIRKTFFVGKKSPECLPLLDSIYQRSFRKWIVRAKPLQQHSIIYGMPNEWLALNSQDFPKIISSVGLSRYNGPISESAKTRLRKVSEAEGYHTEEIKALVGDSAWTFSIVSQLRQKYIPRQRVVAPFSGYAQLSEDLLAYKDWIDKRTFGLLLWDIWKGDCVQQLDGRGLIGCGGAVPYILQQQGCKGVLKSMSSLSKLERPYQCRQAIIDSFALSLESQVRKCIEHQYSVKIPQNKQPPTRIFKGSFDYALGRSNSLTIVDSCSPNRPFE